MELGEEVAFLEFLTVPVLEVAEGGGGAGAMPGEAKGGVKGAAGLRAAAVVEVVLPGRLRAEGLYSDLAPGPFQKEDLVAAFGEKAGAAGGGLCSELGEV